MIRLSFAKVPAVLRGRLVFTRARLVGQRIPRASWRRSPLVSLAAVERASATLRRTRIRIWGPAGRVGAFRFPNRVTQSVQSSGLVEPAMVRPPQSPSRPSSRPVRPFSWRLASFVFLMLASFSLLTALFAPVIYFRFFSHEVVPVQPQELGTPLGGEFAPPQQLVRQYQLPPQEDSLPQGNWLIIPRIGVRTEILESQIPEESLIRGVWRVPEFGQPGSLTEPMIVAAHRYGYNWWWKGEYWRYHSFYLLPDLEPGDVVEVIADQRKYVYEIYAGEEGTEITDYNADLILYTCKFLTSDIRHIRYARLVDPTQATTSQLTAR